MVAVVAAVVGAIFWYATRESGPEAEDAAAPARGTPLTRVGPVSERTVVPRALPVVPLARKVLTEDPPEDEAAPPPSGGVTAAVQDLGPLVEDGTPQPPPRTMEAADAVLDAEPLCYRGTVARRAPSLFDNRGFAITYGADDYNAGDPLPRLEIFFDHPEHPSIATFLSMTHRPVPEFPANTEVPVVYEEAALQALIARWIAAVATETCPR